MRKPIRRMTICFLPPDLNNRKSQVKIFSDIIQICSKHKDKILSIHSRKAHKEVMDAMENFQGVAILLWYSGMQCAKQK